MTDKTMDTLKIGVDIYASEITLTITADEAREILSALSESAENKGEWISHYDEDSKEGWYECSCCHSERAFNTNFCPDCGADMREPIGEKED